MPPHFCIGVFGTRADCNLSRANPGGKISIRGKCKICGEKRCRTHCRCGRRNTVHGREAGRPPPEARPARHAPAPPRPPAASASHAPQPVAPVGRPAAVGAVVLSTTNWWTQLLADVGRASEVSLTTLVFDHPELTNVFLHRLRGGAFELVLVVDKESFETQPPVSREQTPRLRALRRAGAEVVLCRGFGRLGRLHAKALVCDRRVAYCGSANFTAKSSANEELCLCLRGPPVADVLALNTRARLRGERWE